MIAKLGPCVQMVKLAREMALRYAKDQNLALKPLIDHYMDEVEVNIASDTFDHLGFMRNIREELQHNHLASGDERRTAFLEAIIDALGARLQSHPV